MSQIVLAGNPPAMMELFKARREVLDQIAVKGILPERLIRSTMVYISQNKAIQECSAISVFQAVVDAAKLGLDCTGGTLGHGYLVPFKNEAKFMPGYRGLRELALRSGLYIDIFSEVVYRADDFDLHLGSDPRIIHRPNIHVARHEEDIIGAYTVATGKNGYKHPPDWVDLAYILKCREASRGAWDYSGNLKGPWKEWPAEMYRKTAMRHGCKGLSLSPELRAAFEADDEDVAFDDRPAKPTQSRELYKPATINQEQSAAKPAENYASGPPAAAGFDIGGEGETQSGGTAGIASASPPTNMPVDGTASAPGDLASVRNAAHPLAPNVQQSRVGPGEPGDHETTVAPAALRGPPKTREELRERFEALFFGREVPWYDLVEYEVRERQGRADTFKPMTAQAWLDNVKAGLEVQS